MLAGLLATALPAFGGEDPVLGRPWYHAELTRQAARSAGWDGAADDLAWQAQAVDVYLYHPLHRLRRRPELHHFHFDDLPDADAVAARWEQHTAACVAGLLWCRRHDDVAAARHVIGLTLHALQDFYAHSTWVDDPARRGRTWWEAPPGGRTGVRTGSYRLPGSPAHGGLAVRPPWAGGPPGPTHLLGRRALGRLLRPAPDGINLDTCWQAPVGAANRRPPDGAGAGELFASALALAGRTSRQWLTHLDRLHADDAFWSRVRRARLPPRTRTRPFHDPSRRLAPLLAAGPASWFLRLAGPGWSEVHGPYRQLPPHPPYRPGRDPVEVFAVRPAWPLQAGPAYRRDGEGRPTLDRAGLRTVAWPTGPLAPR